MNYDSGTERQPPSANSANLLTPLPDRNSSKKTKAEGQLLTVRLDELTNAGRGRRALSRPDTDEAIAATVRRLAAFCPALPTCDSDTSQPLRPPSLLSCHLLPPGWRVFQCYHFLGRLPN